MNTETNRNNRWAAFSDSELNTISSALWITLQYFKSGEKEFMYSEIMLELARRRQYIHGGVKQL